MLIWRSTDGLERGPAGGSLTDGGKEWPFSWVQWWERRGGHKYPNLVALQSILVLLPLSPLLGPVPPDPLFPRANLSTGPRAQ